LTAKLSSHSHRRARDCAQRTLSPGFHGWSLNPDKLSARRSFAKAVVLVVLTGVRLYKGLRKIGPLAAVRVDIGAAVRVDAGRSTFAPGRHLRGWRRTQRQGLGGICGREVGGQGCLGREDCATCAPPVGRTQQRGRGRRSSPGQAGQDPSL
jgi:hypothetical protein